MAEKQPVSLIESLRKRIDELDEQLVRLLSARAACALEVGRAKKAMGVQIYQPGRETEVLAHVVQTYFAGSPEQAVTALLRMSDVDVSDNEIERLRSAIRSARQHGR